MENLRAKIGKFERLFIGHPLDLPDITDHARIGRQDAVNVGPDLHALRVHGRTDDRRAEIRALPPHGRVGPRTRHADESLGDRHDAFLQGRTEHLFDLLHDDLHQGQRSPEIVVREHKILCVNPDGLHPRLLQPCGNDPGREAFAVGTECIHCLGRELFQDANPLDEIDQFLPVGLKHDPKPGDPIRVAEEVRKDIVVPLHETVHERGGPCNITRGGSASRLFQFIGRLGDRGNDDNGSMGEVCGNDAENVRH